MASRRAPEVAATRRASGVAGARRAPGVAGARRAPEVAAAWLRRRYGAGPLHLLSLVACLALVGYAVTRIHAQGGLVWIALWWVVSLVAHDLVGWPLYALADRRAVRAARRHPTRLPAVPWINHLRVPAVISGILLLVSFPLVGRLSETTYVGDTGYTEAPYLGHWLLATGVLFGASAVLYALRLARARRPGRAY